VSERLTSTKNPWLAAHYIANGLAFARATRLPGPGFRANLFFFDPGDEAPKLTKTFFDDVAAQRLIAARRVVGEVIDVVRHSGVAQPEDVADELAMMTNATQRALRPRGE